MTDTTIALLGATGFTGRHVLTEALGRGFRVRALVRDATRLEAHPRLTVLEGDARKLADLETLVTGAHSIIHCMGSPPGTATTLVSDVTALLLKLMPQHDVDRLICMSNTGAHRSGSWFARRVFIPVFLRWLLPIIADKERMEDLLLAHPQVRWTSLRFPNIREGARSAVRVSLEGADLRFNISTPNAAAVLVDQVRDDTWLGQMPCVSDA